MTQPTIKEAISTLAKVGTKRLTATRHLFLENRGNKLDVVDQIAAKDWIGLSSQGTQMVESAKNRMGSILKRRKQVGDNKKLALATDRRLSKSVKKSLAIVNDAEFIQAVKARLKADGLTSSEINAWLSGLKENISMDPRSRKLGQRLNAVAEELDNRFFLLARTALLGIECRCVARFNRIIKKPNRTLPLAEQLTHLNRNLRSKERTIENCDRKAQRLVKMGDWKRLLAHADSVTCEAMTARLACRELVEMAAKLEALRNHPRITPKERSRAVSATSRCGRLIRRQLLSYAIAFEMVHLSTVGNGSARGRAEQKRAGSLPFKSLSTGGKLLTLKKLLSDPDGWHREIVAVDGEIQALKTEVKRGKATSNFKLVDPASGLAINVFVPYIRIDSTGLVNECGVHLVGQWLKYDRESRQNNTLHIDRISFTKQAKGSWLDYRTSQARSFFDYLPHNLNMEWSWQSGVPGAVNQIFHTTIWERGV